MKLIKFTSMLDDGIGAPEPIKKFIPEWYKKAETYYVSESDNVSVEDGTQEEMAGLKTCVPFLDCMISGYAIVTPFDIFIGKNDDGTLAIRWNGPDSWEDFINERPKESGSTMPRPTGHYPNHLVWSNRWGFRAPRGYSVLITHPLNRHDLPFTTLSGLIDSDNFWANGNIPFFIKEDFLGVIPKGTPIAQIIPIKRKKWKMIKTQGYKDIYNKQGNLARQKETKYKKKDWVKKVFE